MYAEQFPPAAAWATETNDAFTLMRAGCLETLVTYEADGTLAENLATTWEQRTQRRGSSRCAKT